MLRSCPDCGSSESSAIGQYVYYSRLIKLRQCGVCGLVYSDTIIDPGVTRSHWDAAYKDDDYFVRSRRAIFSAIVDLIDRYVPVGGSVLDIGGAKGHLMSQVRQRRPDLRLTVNDISEISCAAAREQGLEALCCPLSDLQPNPDQYNCLVLLDVIYYEPDVRGMWDALQRMTAPGGLMLIRIPNKLWLIRTAAACRNLICTTNSREKQTHVPFFNPEYILAFSRRYLNRRLCEHGFESIQFLPSPMPLGRGYDVLCRSAYSAASALRTVGGGMLVLSPSQIILSRARQK